MQNRLNSTSTWCLTFKQQGVFHFSETNLTGDCEPWHASIIHGSVAHLPAMKINLKWPLPRPGEELMFPKVHIGPGHRVVMRTLRKVGAFQVRTQYTLLTPLILDYCHVRLMPVITHRPGQKGRLLCPEVSLPKEVLWLNRVGDNKSLHSFFFSGARSEFSGQRNQIWSNHCNYDTFDVIHIITGGLY